MQMGSTTTRVAGEEYRMNHRVLLPAWLHGMGMKSLHFPYFFG
jgi:hypothetical protein